MAWNAKPAVFLVGVIIKIPRIPGACLDTTENEAHTKSRGGKNQVLADIPEPLTQLAPVLPDREFLLYEMIRAFIDYAGSSWGF